MKLLPALSCGTPEQTQGHHHRGGIRINPKNMGAYDERNHVNMVFLSNETKPVVLERDDRRYAVVWTPAKLDPAFYETVRLEMEAGGIAALHHRLKTLPLGTSNPGRCHPPPRPGPSCSRPAWTQR